jgi:zinc D-Ala-D-Ala carboxypeptidase
MKFLVTLYLCFIFINYHNLTVEVKAIDTVENDNLKGNDVVNDTITKAFVLGKFNYKNDPTFIKIDSNYTAKTIYLKKEVAKAFIAMSEAAKNDNVELKIISGTRNFYEQKAIWERKWQRYDTLNNTSRAKKILEYSSMPSSSRHHWGTDVDLNSLNNSYFNTEKGKAIYNWLIRHANQFGFYQVYTSKNNGRTGYNEEKWHWSYLPLASKYLQFYNENVDHSDINGFKGHQLADDLLIIEHYVNGISEKAKRNK